MPLPPDYGGLGADAVTWALVIEELGRVDSSVAVTLSVTSGLAGGMIARHGTDEQKRAVAAAGRRRRDPRQLRAHGALRRLRRARPAHDGTPGRRRLDDRRLEVLHHEQRHADLRVRRRRLPHRRRAARRLDADRAVGQRGLRGRPAVPEDGLALERHARDLVPGVPRAGGSPPRRARPRAPPVPDLARRRADRDRRDVGRPRAGVPRREPRLRGRARGVRSPDRLPTRPSRSRSRTCRWRSRRRGC